MKKIPSISNEINEDVIFKIISKNFSKIAPYWFELLSSWLIRSYNVFQDIDKYIILVYLINKDLIFFRKNGLIVDYDTFYNDKSIEIPKINISDISTDLKIPKESIRRKLQELEEAKVIRKNGKKIFVDRSAFITAKPQQTLKELTALLSKFSEILIEEKIINRVFTADEITASLKNNFSFCWYQFYKLVFIYTNRMRNALSDLESVAIGLVVLLNSIGNKSFRVKDLNMKQFTKLSQGADEVGVNAMSLSDITGIPRPTVVRKIKRLIEINFLHINEKKLITMDIKGSSYNMAWKIQNQNIKNLSNMLHRIFNQIRVINSD
jgi:predicted transcriptional regulator